MLEFFKSIFQQLLTLTKNDQMFGETGNPRRFTLIGTQFFFWGQGIRKKEGTSPRVKWFEPNKPLSWFWAKWPCLSMHFCIFIQHAGLSNKGGPFYKKSKIHMGPDIFPFHWSHWLQKRPKSTYLKPRACLAAPLN